MTREVDPMTPDQQRKETPMVHSEPFEGAGHTYPIDLDGIDGKEIRVEDWWDRAAGMSWMVAEGNPACMRYAMRSAFAGLPVDDEVVYGKVGPFGYLVHVSELGERAS